MQTQRPQAIPQQRGMPLVGIRERTQLSARSGPSIFNKVVYPDEPESSPPIAKPLAAASTAQSPRMLDDVLSVNSIGTCCNFPSPLVLTALRLDLTSAGFRDVGSDISRLHALEVLHLGDNHLGLGQIVHQTVKEGFVPVGDAGAIRGLAAGTATAPGAAFWALGILLPALRELFLPGAVPARDGA